MAKIALVTGGMGGIGTAMCKALAKDGHKVVTTYFVDGYDPQNGKIKQMLGLNK